ncbi:MAG: mechanosensitive ion channel [Clostridia bacterium]|nr:mechanosensitive ion channel [Clostridia bacterium]
MEWFKNLWETMKNTVMANWHNVLKFALVLVVGAVVIRIAVSIVKKLLNGEKSKLKGAAANFLTGLIKAALVCLYVIILLSALGVDTTSLVAIFSVLTLAVSLAVQGVISNLASGIMLIVTKPFEVGNFVDIGGASGTVEDITINSTKLRTGDNKVIIIPNSNVTSANITNYSTKETRRLDLTFSVAYGSDVEQVKKIILGVIAKHDEVLQDPAPMVRLTEHGASSLDFVTRVWVKQADYWPVNFDLKEEVLAAFDAAGISVPFPQLDVHMVNN